MLPEGFFSLRCLRTHSYIMALGDATVLQLSSWHVSRKLRKLVIKLSISLRMEVGKMQEADEGFRQRPRVSRQAGGRPFPSFAPGIRVLPHSGVMMNTAFQKSTRTEPSCGAGGTIPQTSS
mmetsp:Transcript_32735/g.94224  ORF Transcript_32735/g.94224 Transcript_32735/m.94224 type:complete len:121 (+) Transcript_32735:303-665(+)